LLYFLLVTCGFLLVVTNLLAYRLRHPGGWIVGLCLVSIFGQPFLMVIIPLLALQAALLIAALCVWRVSGRGPSTYLALSGGSMLVVLGIGLGIALASERDYGRLRVLYAYRSMEGRLPGLAVSGTKPPLAPEAQSRLERIEAHHGMDWMRERRLRKLHEEKVQLFIDSFGFGYSRMLPGPSDYNLAWNTGALPPQPGARVVSSESPNEWLPARAGDQAAMGRLLDKGILDFANPGSFGYIKNRQQVAGFSSHRFIHVPRVFDAWEQPNPADAEPVERWDVRSLDLVGLLLDPSPRVYVSDRLPSMDKVREVPTRPLDQFEAVGLAALRDGDDLWIARIGEGARMVGALRNAQQCLACHEGRRGDLLGAFSYTLAASKPTDAQPTHR
jgi:hypothetical protein